MPTRQSLFKSCLYLHRNIIKLTHNDVVGGATELGRLLSVPRTNTDHAYLQGLTDVQLRTEQRKRLSQLRKAQKAYANQQRAQTKGDRGAYCTGDGAEDETGGSSRGSRG
ncbi:hypothetical protein LTS18_004108 [Coniosporium uncinatum]|uniref:Uncharacterized protein n=1 Tax=Coniosporium uncinatum TaxID=93489 RepID=A0ACC3DYN6_9PEZI|nr:hypothetical protein LTS18_004108 [Coniosporium uncinatum]